MPYCPNAIYLKRGIADEPGRAVLCNVKLNHEHEFEQASESFVVERPCILLQLYGGDSKKKNKCCKNYKKDKACKKCPRD